MSSVDEFLKGDEPVSEGLRAAVEEHLFNKHQGFALTSASTVDVVTKLIQLLIPVIIQVIAIFKPDASVK